MLRSFIISAAIISGSLCAMGLDYAQVSLRSMLMGLAGLGLIAIIIEARLYGKFKVYVQTGDTFVIRQKESLEKKLSVFHDKTGTSQ